MSITFYFIVFQMFQWILFPFFLPYLMVKHIAAQTNLSDVQELSGFVPYADHSKKIVWFHALSAGEVLSIQYVVDELKKENPDTLCYLTAGTEEGKRVARKHLNVDYVSLLPYDSLPTMLLAFNRINPTALVVLEHEVWPNMVMLSKLKEIPLFLLNAQMTPTSEKTWLRLKPLYSTLFSGFDHIFAQSEQDKNAFVEKLDINPEKIEPIGNIKAFNVKEKKDIFVQNLTRDLQEYKSEDHIVLMIGSVHQGELDPYLELFSKLKKEFPTLKLILAPRYFSWKEELLEKVKVTNFKYFMWDNQSEALNNSIDLLADVSHDILTHNDILLVCTMGKMFSLYALVDLYFLGGTFVPVGGHNLLEPAVWGNPIIIGPHHQNTKDIADQLENRRALIKVSDTHDLLHNTHNLLVNQKIRKEMGLRAQEWLEHESKMVKKKLEPLFKRIKAAHLMRSEKEFETEIRA